MKTGTKSRGAGKKKRVTRLRGQVIALALLATFASDSWGQLPQPSTQSKQATQPSASDQRGTDQVPLTVKILPALDAKEKTDKEDRDREEKAKVDEKLAFETQRIADYTDRLAAFTVALFCVALLQAGLFFWQLRYMRQGMRDAEMAAKAAQDSAEATKESVILAKDTAKRQLRAYIIVQGTRFEGQPGHFISHFRVENTGPTPAHKVKIVSMTRVLQHPVRRDFDFSFPELPDPSSGLLGPNKDVTSLSAFDRSEVSSEEYDEAVADNGWLRIYTYGTVTYEDVFHETQWTHFCYYFQWTGNKVAATASEHHNDAS